MTAAELRLRIMVDGKAHGFTLDVTDLIAATAEANECIVVTANQDGDLMCRSIAAAPASIFRPRAPVRYESRVSAAIALQRSTR
jgi:hypothetical protein